MRVDKGESGDEHVQDAVGNGNVQSHERHQGRQDEQLDRTQDRQLELGPRAVAPHVELAVQCLVPRLLAQTGRFLLQYHGSVRLLHEDKGQDGQDAAEDNEQPVDPAPAGGRDEIAAGDGSDARPQKGPQGPGRHGAAAVLDRDDVCDAAASDGDGDRARETHEEAERKEHTQAV